ncbi:2-amino-4-hydroxy-6-hydroxymethyldihydropteridine diphosphokinase [Pseudooceanicola sp. C21-150M6]|uniref:2-amino-4-hydroxy-6- hydroxymethyldihydropteridine diphosphokinase n=1 Tax=Pseudooceanicola sp. C21-150M6 TaxID=3434355 RepID=UPI003D7F360C
MKQSIRTVANLRKLTYFVALGSNLSAKGLSAGEILHAAVARLRDFADVVSVSRQFRSPAFPPGSGPDFMNAAACLRSDLPPRDFLNELHGIEAAFGRQRKKRWAPRPLDLDVIACGQTVLPDVETWRHWKDLPLAAQRQEAPTTMILPHPRMQERNFVLVPLMDIASEWRHPVLGRTISEFHADLSEEDRRSMVSVTDPGCQ